MRTERGCSAIKPRRHNPRRVSHSVALYNPEIDAAQNLAGISTMAKLKRRRDDPTVLGWRPFLVMLAIGTVIAFVVGLTGCAPTQTQILVAGGSVIVVAGIAVAAASYLWKWRGLANAPLRLLGQRHTDQAETAFENARTYARNLPASDYRRGIMLLALTTYLRATRRHAEALAYFEEAAALLREHRDAQPLNYVIALTNYAQYLAACRRFEAAQRLLEEVIDFLPPLKKPTASRGLRRAAENCESILQMNIAFVLIEIGAADQAEPHLETAAAALPLAPRGDRASLQEGLIMLRCRMHCALGDFARAEEEISHAANPDQSGFDQIRAAVSLSRGEFARAEAWARSDFANPGFVGETHRPETLELRLILANALFGQAKLEEAFKAFEEARSVVADFGMPADEYWRKTLATWLQRAKDEDRAILATSLEQEITKVAATPLQAVMVLDKLRTLQ
jgi:tetratricopeptide (TPR) repeat protein